MAARDADRWRRKGGRGSAHQRVLRFSSFFFLFFCSSHEPDNDALREGMTCHRRQVVLRGEENENEKLDDASKFRSPAKINQGAQARDASEPRDEEGSPEFSLEGIRSKKRGLNRDAVGPLCSTASFSRVSVSSSSSSSVAGMTPIAIRSGTQLPMTVDF